MKYLRVLLVLILVAIIFININVNSAFVLKNTPAHTNAYNNHNLIRLHVVAHSNSPFDQYVKRRVRDEVLNYMLHSSGLNDGKFELAELEGFLNNYLQQEKNNYRVKVDFGHYFFPRRTYELDTLPPGEYKALRILLGSGQGSNWWCVLLPPLCIEDDRIAVELGNQITIGQQLEGERPEYRFKIIELLKQQGLRDQTWLQALLKKLDFLLN